VTGHPADETAATATGAGLDVTERQRERTLEYRSLMRKWWFAAAVGAPEGCRA
jgi:hypothetical protein